MKREVKLRRLKYLSALLCSMAVCLAASGETGSGQNLAAGGIQKSVSDKTAGDAAPQESATADKDNGLVIEPTELPPTYPRGPYQVKFHARGNYVPVLHWRVEKGTLPPGITLDDNGLLHGEAQKPGEFHFVVAVKDGGNPQQAVHKEFVIKVVQAITVAWKVPAHVNVNRIEGSVEVTNSTADDIDLTYDVKAVAENGRATEIGYQHFPLRKGTIGMILPFGDTLPDRSYVVYVTVVGEVAKRNTIYREVLQTPGPLQVVTTP